MRALIFALAFLASGALAQDLPGGYSPPIADTPVGAPYNTAERSRYDTVSVRDYLSSRIDQLRIEILDRIEQIDRAQTRIIDERDRQYSQRFAAQQAAVEAALSSAKEAVDKAESASNERFAGVNEFRATLSDQAQRLASKESVESLDGRIDNLTQRLDRISGTGEGANALWVWQLGFVVAAAVVIGLVLNFVRRPVTK